VYNRRIQMAPKAKTVSDFHKSEVTKAG